MIDHSNLFRKKGLHALPILIVALMSCVCCCSTATAQYSTWMNVPALESANKAYFGNLFLQAHTSTVRMAMFGDSQETVPGAGGTVYIPSLNLEFNRIYGNTPESSVAFARSYSNEWLLAGSNAGASLVFTSGSDLLPSQWVGRFSSSAGELGLLAQLNTTAENTPFANRPGFREFAGNNVTVQIIGRNWIGSSEIAWRVNLQPGDSLNYYGGTNIGSGVTSMGLGNSASGYSSQTVGTFSLGATNDSMQVIARGSGITGADVAGVRFINADNPAGLAIQSFSAGGYTVSQFLNQHADAGDAFRAFGDYDAVMVHFGVNDTAAITALQFASDLQNLIDRMRTWASNPDLAIILMSDPDREGLTASQRTQFDMFPGAAAAVALANSNVLAVNSRRLADGIGWTAGGPLFTNYVSDGVHYTTLGGQSLAELEVTAMYSLTSIPEAGCGLVLLMAGTAVALSRRRRIV